MNGVSWSECLDEVFIDNADNDTRLAWQYFAASDGYMRMFPATKWVVVWDGEMLVVVVVFYFASK